MILFGHWVGGRCVGAVVLTLVLLEGKDPRRWGEINNRTQIRPPERVARDRSYGVRVVIALLRLLLAGAAFVRRACRVSEGGAVVVALLRVCVA